MTTTEWVTGWCSGPNHHLCHHVYDVKDRVYTCTCQCHGARPVKQVPRRPEKARPVRYVKRRARRS